MIHKKYVIAVSYNGYAIGNLQQSPNVGYGNNIKFEIESIISTVAKTQYMNNIGTIDQFPYFYDFYEEAYDVLSIYHNNIYNNNTLNGDLLENSIVEIKEVFDDIPIDNIKARKYKIKKLLGY